MGNTYCNKTELDILIGIGGIDMERKILKASEGKILTNGEIYGAEIYLADGIDESSFYEVDENNVQLFEEAEPEDYKNALARLGVDDYE